MLAFNRMLLVLGVFAALPVWGGYAVPVQLGQTEHTFMTTFHLDGEWSGRQTHDLALQADKVWVGTDKGILIFDRPRAQWSWLGTPQGLPGEIVTEIAVSPSGLVAMALMTRHANGAALPVGTYLYDPRSGQFDRVSDSVARDLAWQGQRLWWVDQALHVRQADGQVQTIHVPAEVDLLQDARLFGVATDPQSIWLAVAGKLDQAAQTYRQGGVARYQPDSRQWQTWRAADGLASEICVTLAQDDRTVWVAHWDEALGLSRLPREHGQWQAIYRASGGEAIGGVQLALTQTHVWVGQQEGVIKLNRDDLKAIHYQQADGLPGYIVSGLQADAEGVWLAAYAYEGQSDRVATSGIAYLPSQQVLDSRLMDRYWPGVMIITLALTIYLLTRRKRWKQRQR